MTDTIKAIQKQIVAKLEAGEDVSELTGRLAQERAKIAAQAEVEQLKKIADTRQLLRNRAEAITVKVKRQDEGIDRFLKLRDTIISQIKPSLEEMKELADMQSMGRFGMGECYAAFNDRGQFAAAVRGIPGGYLPSDFGCPFVSMIGDKTDALDKANEAYSYFSAVLGILGGFMKGTANLSPKPAEGLMAIDNEDETELGNCIVCQHAEVERINQAFKDGKSLRFIEAEFGDVSRSSLSRHKNTHLNLGAIRIVEVSEG